MSANGASELPRGWAWTTLGEVSLINPRSFARAPGEDDLVSFVPMAAVEAMTRGMDTSQARPYEEVKKGYTPFSEGDVLFAKITPCMENGKIALARGLANGSGCGSTEFHVLRPLAGMPGEFLMYYLFRDDFRKEARGHMTGTAGQLRVPVRFLSESPLPLPSLPEQRRIVAEIEKHFTRLDAAVASLHRARANLKRYRASVLKAACEGRLVPTEADLARREGRASEPASVLLERILNERRARWEAQPGRRGKYHEPQPPDITNLPPLPEGWTWTTLGSVAAVKGGVTKGERQRPGAPYREVAYLRVANVQRGYLDLSEVKTIKATEADISALRLEPGDILLNEGGDRDKLGRGWVWAGEIGECIHQNHVFRARPFSRDIEPKFISYYANSAGQTYMLTKGKQTTNLASISMTLLVGLPVPLPPLAEQQRIVAEVERHLSMIEASENVVSANLKRAERLRQAILKRAFQGKLVPQDPDDESALGLLERIRAESATGEVSRPTRKRRGTPTRRRKQPEPTHPAAPDELLARRSQGNAVVGRQNN